MNNAGQQNGSGAILRDALSEIRKLRTRVEELERDGAEPIAVVGIGCRFPGGADSPDAYWRLLRDGVDAVREVPADRWDLAAWYDPDPEAPGKMYTRALAALDDLRGFDAGFFGVSPREAASIDPQQRLLLEVAWEAIENAGHSPARLGGSQTGVFVGLFSDDYGQSRLYRRESGRIDAHAGMSVLRGLAAGRIAYFLDLHGPAMEVDTACSSSLLTIHLACQSLRAHECNFALAGGVNVVLSPEITVALCRLRAMSAQGRSRAFSAGADGYVRGEGCGMVALKRLSDARRDGDRVVAVVRGSAVNHDGRSNGIAAPNGSAQESVLRAALANARVRPNDVQYVEAHGTGTILGDPIEALALGAVFGAVFGERRTGPLQIGSVKTNIGHLESAAGVAAFLKVALAIEHGEIPPHLHFTQPNPYIPWERLSLDVPTALTKWPENREARIAGVSAFGMSGTNVHMILASPPAEPEAVEQRDSDRRVHLLCLSARSESALRALAARYADALEANPGWSLADVCFTANAGRTHFRQRRTWVCESPGQLRDQLRSFSIRGAEVAVDAASVPPDLLNLKQLYESGSDINWESFDHSFRRRIPLPTYPFEREPYFIESAPSAPAEPREIRLSQVSPAFLQDHRVFGQAVVPASVWCEMALGALSATSLEDVIFHEALFLPETGEAAVRTSLSPDGSFEIFSLSADGKRTLHASGKASHAELRRSDANAPEIGAAENLPVAAFYEERAARGIGYGPAFRALTELKRSDGGAEGWVELPAACGTGSYSIHPVLLDACCTVCASLFAEAHQGETWIPAAIRRIELHRPPGARLRCRATTHRANEADLSIYDAHGVLVAAISGFALRRLKSEAIRTLYQIAWQPAPAAPAAPATPAAPASSRGAEQWFIVPDRGGLSERLERRLTTTADIAGASGILFLCGAEEAALQVTQAALSRGGLRLCFVTRGAVRVGSESDVPGLAESPLWGLGRVVAREHPELSVTLVDLDPSPAGDPSGALIAELLSPAAGEEVAFRDGIRYVARLRPYTAPADRARSCPIRPDATYLITGGLGALGLQVARHLVERGARHLVLAARSAPHPAALDLIEQLRSLDVDARAERVNIADREDAAALLDRLRGAMPALRGIVHAAGILDDGVVSQQTWERFERVLAPKARGAWNLHLLTQDLNLDFFVLFSSASGLLGTPGQSNYAAANAYLDALAHYRRSVGLPALSIDWGPWADAGMAAGMSVRQGVGKIEPADALRSLEQLMAQDLAQVAVLPIQWDIFLRQFDGHVPPLLQALALAGERRRHEHAGDRRRHESAGLLSRAPVSDGPVSHGLVSGGHDPSPGEIRRMLKACVREEVARVLGFSSPEEVDTSRELLDLGFDSLMGLELRNNLQSSLGCDLRATLVFDHPSVEAIARHLAEDILQLGQSAVKGPPAVPAAIDVDGLAEAEAESLLLHELEQMNY